MVRLLILAAIPLVFLVSGLAWLWNLSGVAVSEVKPEREGVISERAALAAFRDWLDRGTGHGFAEEGTYLEEGLRLAKVRLPLLRNMIRENPTAALEWSLTEKAWNQLPEAILPFVEVPFSSRADVEVFIACATNISRVERTTTLPDGTRFLAYTTPGDRFNRTRLDIPVEGIHIGEVGALWNGPEPETYPFGEPATYVEQGVAAPSVRDMYVILVDFDDMPGQPVDPTLLEGRINGIVSPQILEMSNHLSSVAAVVNSKTYRMPENTSYYVSGQIFREIWDHAYDMVTNPVTGDGIDLSEFETICVYFARIPAITFDGYASLPGEKLWLNGSTSARVITHELGHNYGSYHAHSWNVAGSDPADPTGSHEEYGDPMDIMGFGQLPLGHFHVQNKLQVGWLGVNNFNDVTASGTYRIYRGDHPLTDATNAQLRGLRLLKSPDNYYWLGYRQLYESYESYGRGLYVLWQQPNPDNYPKSHLLDITPGSDTATFDKFDGGLAMGTTYSDPAAGLHITPVGRGGFSPNEWMDVVVNMGDFSGNAAPSISIDGPTAGVARESLRYELIATDAEGDDLAYSWDVGDGLIKENKPGLTHAWLVGGNYTIRCTVSDMKGGVSTVEKAVTISEPLDNWTDSQTVTGVFVPQLFDIAASESRAVTVGTNGFYALTEDGSNWGTGYVEGNLSGNLYLYGIVHDGSQFVVVGKDYVDADWIGVIFTSPDGENWTRRYAGGDTLNDVAAGNGKLVAVGISNTILHSTNGGVSWTPVAGLNYGNFTGVTFKDPWFVTVGSGYPVVGPVVLISSSWSSWYDVSASTGTGSTPFADVQACGEYILASGPGLGIRASANGGFSFTAADPGGYTIPAFAHGNGVYFAAGTYGADINLVSGNGLEWTNLATTSQPDRTAAVFFKNSFITVGGSGSIWRSPLLNDPTDSWGVWYYVLRPVLGLNRDPDDDADGDGAGNVLEYALGTDADNPASRPVISSHVDESGYLFITIPRGRRASDTDYIVEQATSLDDFSTWSDVPTVTVSETETELVVRAAEPLTAASPQLLRLRIRFAATNP